MTLLALPLATAPNPLSSSFDEIVPDGCVSPVSTCCRSMSGLLVAAGVWSTRAVLSLARFASEVRLPS